MLQGINFFIFINYLAEGPGVAREKKILKKKIFEKKKVFDFV